MKLYMVVFPSQLDGRGEDKPREYYRFKKNAMQARRDYGTDMGGRLCARIATLETCD